MRLEHLKNHQKTVLRNKTYKQIKSLGVATILGLFSGTTILFFSPSTIINATDTANASTEIKEDVEIEIPEQITNEGIVASSVDGTAPYYITKADKEGTYNLYFLDGTLGESAADGSNPTSKIIVDIQFGQIPGVKAGFINKIDTSLATGAVIAPKNSDSLFASIENYNMETDEYIFCDLNLSKLDTSNTENMRGMFRRDKLNSLELSNFDTSNVTNMNNMFANLTLGDNKLDLSNFDTSKVTAMDYMFTHLNQDSDDKVDLNLSNFDLSAIESEGLRYMFNSAKVKNLNLDDFKNTNRNITNLDYMFTSVKADKISMKNFDTSAVGSFYNMFSYATIGDLDISNFDMTTIENQSADMFTDATINSLTLGSKNKFVEPGIDEDGNQIGSDSGIGKIIESMIVDPDKKLSINYDLSVPTTIDGEKAADTIIVFNFDGDTKDGATVPLKDGYTINISEIKASLNTNGTISVTPENLTIEYTKKATDNNNNDSGGSSNNNNIQENINPTNKEQLVATHPNRGSVRLYKLVNNEFAKVGDRALSEASDWYSDKMADTDDMTYYRVASNEWVKASDVYVYEPLRTIFNTKSKITHLLNSTNSTISDRALSPEINWSVDRIGYLGDYKNPVKTYRVANNEFVIY